jgi:type IV secretory pathway VirB10-like protein
LRSPGYTAPPVQNSQNQPLTITVNNQQVTLPADPAARAQLLETLNEQERQRLAAEAANKHLALKMGRINEIASYLAKNEEYSAIKASDSWLAKPDPNAVTQSKITPAESSTPVTESNDLMIIKTGEKIYVNIETAINTDEPSNVFGKVLSGQARGWTIIGKAVQNPNYTVSVTFETLALPSGTSVAIKAMAIDPNTGRTSVQGDVNHKILDRFIIPVIAGGLGTYGDIMGRQGTTSTINPLTGTTGTVSSNMTTSQVRNAAIGGGVKNVTAVITAEAAKEKPSTSTDKNLGIEVVFLQEVLVNESILHKYAQKGAK